MATFRRWKLWCEDEEAWVFWVLDDGEDEPTTCPNNTGHTITESATSVVETFSDAMEFNDDGELKVDDSHLVPDADGNVKVSTAPRPGSEAYFYIPNLCDACTWYQDADLRTEIGLTDSGDRTTYTSTYENWIDLCHGRMFQEDVITAATPAYLVKVETSPDGQDPWTEKTENTWETSDGDYDVDYEDGSVTFNSQQAVGTYVRATFYQAKDSLTFVVIPAAGKILKAMYIENQFTKDVEPKTLEYQFWAYNPADLPNKAQVGGHTYKTLFDYMWESTGPFPVMPGVAGDRGTKGQDVLTLPYNYLAYKALRASQGVEIRIKTPGAWGGTYASATTYCMSEDE